jgi:hypothetical protein
MNGAQALAVNTRRNRNGAKMAAIAAAAAIAILTTTTGGVAGQNGNGQGQNGNGQGQNGNGWGNHPVPAPAIDTGIPAMILIGGVVLGTTLIRRLRKA